MYVYIDIYATIYIYIYTHIFIVFIHTYGNKLFLLFTTNRTSNVGVISQVSVQESRSGLSQNTVYNLV